jgi:tetratricopeptide (TPR) repeat protein
MNNAWRSPRAGAALIILLTVVAYLPALRAGFVFDDYPLITDNRMIKASDGLHRFWLTTQAPDYYPLTWSLWWVEWRLWGPHPLGYHVVNVLLHAANAVLIWLILRRLKIPGAWLAGLVFALHPVNVATVAWISEQKNTLSMLFFLMALLWYVRFDEEGRWRWYAVSLVSFLLALFSKTAAVMLPVVLLGCLWWRHNRVRWKDLFYSLPFFALSLSLGLVTVWFQHNYLLTGYKVPPTDFCHRLVVAGAVPWFYLYKAFVPINLTVVYPRWETTALHGLAYVPGIVLLSCFAWFWWKRRTWGRPLLFGLGYFVVTLFPVLGFFDQGFNRFSWVADHWQYYSIAGAIALAVAGGVRISGRLGKEGRVWATTAAVIVLSMLAAGSWTRSCVYANDETLWQDNVAKNPSAWMAHDNLGNVLYQAGRIPEAISHFEHALQINPNHAETHDNLASALWQAGRRQEALGHWEQALRIKPNDAKAHGSLGLACAQLGELPEAIEHWKQALRIKPDDARTHNNLGIALVHEGNTNEAIDHFEQALLIKPDYAEARIKLAQLRAGQ